MTSPPHAPARAAGQAAGRVESNLLAATIESIDAHLTAAVRGRGLPADLEAAILYVVEAGGKRLRPALVLLACEAVGGSRDDAMGPAIALELIHTFSLVHDDLPAMDDDAMRRGRPTLHVHANEAMAILAGDAMTSLAFEIVAAAPLPGEARAACVGELAAATTDMIAGQAWDTLGGLPPLPDDEARLRLVHAHKTGALIRAACRMGAICGDADDRRLEALTSYGEAVGLMFQVVDDLLDVTQTAEHLGKATGKDEVAGKLTYPGVLGLQGSREVVERLARRAEEVLADLGPAAEPLRRLAADMAVRTR